MISSKQPPSVRNANFLEDHARAALEELLNHERPPASDDVCAFCDVTLHTVKASAAKEDLRYRCSDCYGIPHLCHACLLRVHALVPFHRLLKWLVTLPFAAMTIAALVLTPAIELGLPTTAKGNHRLD